MGEDLPVSAAVTLSEQFEVPEPILNSPFEEPEEVKAQAARRWAEAVNASGQFGRWAFEIVHRPEDIRPLLDRV